MPPDKKWLDQHFGNPAQPRPEAPSRVGLRVVVAVTVAFVALIAVVTAADYTNFIGLGVVERLGINPRSPRTVPTLIPNDAMQSPSLSSPLFDARAEDSSVDAPELAAGDQPVTTSESWEDAPPIAAAPSASRSSQRVDSLRRGIDMMRRDLQEVANDEVWPTFQVTVRAPPREPFSAAERVQMADRYLASSRKWSPTQLVEIHDVRTRSIAQVTNARIRLKELAQKRASLTKRMEKAQTELGAVP